MRLSGENLGLKPAWATYGDSPPHHRATETQVCGSLHPLHQRKEKLLWVYLCPALLGELYGFLASTSSVL